MELELSSPNSTTFSFTSSAQETEISALNKNRIIGGSEKFSFHALTSRNCPPYRRREQQCKHKTENLRVETLSGSGDNSETLLK